MANETPVLILGDLIFPIASGLRTAEITEQNTLPEHERIDTQPIIQRMGRKLETVTVSLFLHYLQPFFAEGYTVVERLFALRVAKDSAELITLQFGAGFFDGKYVIEKMTTNILQTRPDGDPLIAEIDLDLKGSTSPDDIDVSLEAKVYGRAIAGFKLDDLAIPRL